MPALGSNSYFYGMRWKSDKIGFDDRLVVIVGVVLFTFLVPIVFFGWRIGRPPYLGWNSLWPCAVITTAIWAGCRMIMIWARTRYPLFEQVKKRLWVEIGVTLIYVLLINNVLGPIVFKNCENDMRGAGFRLTEGDIAIDSNASTLLCTMLVCAIYESVYFVSELRKSVEEKELLRGKVYKHSS